MKSNTPLFFEALNATHKAILEVLCEQWIQGINELERIADRIRALNLITAAEICDSDKEYFKNKNVWSDIFQLRKILHHPCPQNKYIGDTNALPISIFSRPRKEDVESGIKDGKVYYFIDGVDSEIKSEKQGLLGLTGRNDHTAPPVSKEAVVYYVQELINKAILKNKTLMGIPLPVSDGLSSVMNRHHVISESAWLVALAKNSAELHPLLYIEGVKNKEPFLCLYRIVATPERNILVGHQSAARIQSEYHGQQGVFQLFKISSEAGAVLQKNLKAEIISGVSRFSIFRQKARSALLNDAVERSFAWISKKLEQINLIVDQSVFVVKNNEALDNDNRYLLSSESLFS